ncbi:MAG: sensor histidine kinase [Candidatus Limiplasma sp.]|nr:sensor histidine kinase [Candidatus Limiplasma sp.]
MAAILQEKRRKTSIRKRLFTGMTLILLGMAGVITLFSAWNTYQALYGQLMQSKQESLNWFVRQTDLSLQEYTNRFYTFEVAKEVKSDIQAWCRPQGELEYAARWRLISTMNAVMGMDAAIQSMELYNLQNRTVLVAQRSGAKVLPAGDGLDFWEAREPGLQTNLAVHAREGAVLLSHQINRFEDGMPLALVVCRMRPSFLGNLLEDVLASQGETAYLLNDENQIVYQGGEGSQESASLALRQLPLLAAQPGEAHNREGSFWFYRSMGRGKLQILQAVPGGVITGALQRTLLVGVGAALAALLAALVFSLVFSRAVSKPIVALAQKMQHVTIREYAVREKTRRADEVGLLENSFEVMMARNQELIAQKFQTRLEKRSAQLRALQAQINPHFMYNTLQIIGGMALHKDAPEIYGITVQLSDIMRYSMSFAKEMVPLGVELEYLEAYLGIQNQRFDGRIQVHTRIEPRLMDCLIPKLILQPVIENSLEHGLQGKAGPWEIELRGELAGGDLRLWVRDNGLGMEPERLAYIQGELAKGAENAIASGAHIGLNNVNSRIRLRDPGDYGVRITSVQGEGTTVEIAMRALWEEEECS